MVSLSLTEYLFNNKTWKPFCQSLSQEKKGSKAEGYCSDPPFVLRVRHSRMLQDLLAGSQISSPATLFFAKRAGRQGVV